MKRREMINAFSIAWDVVEEEAEQRHNGFLASVIAPQVWQDVARGRRDGRGLRPLWDEIFL